MRTEREFALAAPMSASRRSLSQTVISDVIKNLSVLNDLGSAPRLLCALSGLDLPRIGGAQLADFSTHPGKQSRGARKFGLVPS